MILCLYHQWEYHESLPGSENTNQLSSITPFTVLLPSQHGVLCMAAMLYVPISIGALDKWSFFFGDAEVNGNSWMKLDGQYGQCTWADLEVTHEFIVPTE